MRPTAAVTTAPTAAKPAPPAPVTQGPSWKSLTSEQQRALAPLKSKWNRLGPQRKQKWLEISKNFASLSAEEQARMHSRMSAWIAMSSKQREQARLNYAQSKELSAEEKAAHWEAYQNLSPEQKRKLATRNPAKPAGAALVTPSSPNKLTPIQPAQRPQKHPSNSRVPPQPAKAAQARVEPDQEQPDRQ